MNGIFDTILFVSKMIRAMMSMVEDVTIYIARRKKTTNVNAENIQDKRKIGF